MNKQTFGREGRRKAEQFNDFVFNKIGFGTEMLKVNKILKNWKV